jgi:ABC-type lipoprotein release transport system permease subunit
MSESLAAVFGCSCPRHGPAVQRTAGNAHLSRCNVVSLGVQPLDWSTFGVAVILFVTAAIAAAAPAVRAIRVDPVIAFRNE